MVLLRFLRRWLVSLTLIVQLAGAAAASIGLCCEPDPTSPAAADKMECCKEGGAPGHVCPLTKKPAAPTPAPAEGMRSCCDLELQALAALLGGVPGVSEPSSTFSYVPDTAPATLVLRVAAPRWIARVESPPPRT